MNEIRISRRIRSLSEKLMREFDISRKEADFIFQSEILLVAGMKFMNLSCNPVAEALTEWYDSVKNLLGLKSGNFASTVLLQPIGVFSVDRRLEECWPKLSRRQRVRKLRMSSKAAKELIPEATDICKGIFADTSRYIRDVFLARAGLIDEMAIGSKIAVIKEFRFRGISYIREAFEAVCRDEFGKHLSPEWYVKTKVANILNVPFIFVRITGEDDDVVVCSSKDRIQTALKLFKLPMKDVSADTPKDIDRAVKSVLQEFLEDIRQTAPEDDSWLDMTR